MNNFLDFIKKDIEAKKNLISTMPTKTKTNKKKVNQKIDTIIEKYNEYEKSVRNYLEVKARSFEVKEKVKNVDSINEKILKFEHAKFLLNPSNTYSEKMGFDTLLYQINNYYTLNFHSLNEIINGFLDKFELADIILTSDDFDYTCYVHEYMSAFLEVRKKKDENYEKVSEIFEQIYWANPEIIEHIELNFRKLINKYEKKFNTYITKLQNEVMEDNGVTSYAKCLEKLKEAYVDLNLMNEETVYDIVELAKSGKIEIEQYLENNKVRKAAYVSLLPNVSDYNDSDKMEKVIEALEKLKVNLKEYSSYLEFLPLFKDFKEEYEKEVTAESKKNDYSKGLKEITQKINDRENELEKLNKKIFGGKQGIFKSNVDVRKLKIESVYKAKKLYELYKEYDQAYFKVQVEKILSNTLTISDLLHLYYSFDYFKKLAIQKVYKLKTYDEIIKYSENFDLFAMNPMNIIITGIPVFENANVARTISNKYHLNNIEVDEEDLTSENIKLLLNKILLILRTNKIENSKTSLDKIWFMAQVNKIIKEDKK